MKETSVLLLYTQVHKPSQPAEGCSHSIIGKTEYCFIVLLVFLLPRISLLLAIIINAGAYSYVSY
jgi:hypothetical protein